MSDKQVKALFAWVTTDEEGFEGVPVGSAGREHGLPVRIALMGFDAQCTEDLRKVAQQAADELGRPVKLVRSTGIEVVEVLQPSPHHAAGSCR